MHQSKTIITALLALLALLVLLGGVYVWQKKRSSPSVSETPSEQSPSDSSVPPTSAPVDTSNWKTYRNEEYGIEVSYPRDWSIDTERSVENEVVFHTNIPESREAIFFQKNTRNLTPKDWVRMNQEKHRGVILEEREIHLAGVTAHEIETGEFGQRYIVFVENSILYRITTMGMMGTRGVLETLVFFKVQS